MSTQKIGFALGGGGARGAAHIGVLQVLHDNGIRFDHLAGSSAGAVIGAMYSFSQDPYWIEKRFYDFMSSDEFKALGTDRMTEERDPDSVFSQFANSIRDQVVIMMARNRKSIIRREKLESCIKFLLTVDTFDALQIPIEIVAADLNSGEPVIYNNGDLIEAVTQSSSIPGFVSPLEKNKRLIVDGGIIAPTPLNQLIGKADYLIASDIARRIMKPMKKLDIISISMRSDQATSLELNSELLQNADFVIRPEVLGLHWSRFDEFAKLVQYGRQAAEETVDDLKASINKHGKWNSRFRRWLRKKI